MIRLAKDEEKPRMSAEHRIITYGKNSILLVLAISGKPLLTNNSARKVADFVRLPLMEDVFLLCQVTLSLILSKVVGCIVFRQKILAASDRCSTTNENKRWRSVITHYLHKGDLPSDIKLSGNLAIDTEAMGLNNKRDRLCLVQISDGNGDAHLVQFDKNVYKAPNLTKFLTDASRVKIFHFARFDLAVIREYMGIRMENIYCTRTASRLVRTYTDKHGYKDICKELLGVEVSKQQQSSDWGTANLSPEQMEYAASDVLHLHKLKAKLDDMLVREGRQELFESCCRFLPYRAELDLAGFENADIFAHS